MPIPPSPAPFSTARLATLEALARVILPHAFDDVAQGETFMAVLTERVRSAPAGVARDLLRILDAFGSRVLTGLIAHRVRPIALLPPHSRADAFGAFAVSSLPIARAAHQAIRRFVLQTYYSTPEAQRELGLRPPLHERMPAVPWEGPIPGGDTRDDEPVARVPRAGDPVPRAHPALRPPPAGVTLGSTLHGDLHLTADVAIVGSGAGGAVAAARFAEGGREVVILEEGEYLQAADFTEREDALVPRLYADGGLRATSDGAIALLQGAAAGGGTTVNWMLMLRTPDEVLDEWARELGIPGLGADVMGPALDRIEREVHARRVPDDAHAPANRLILDGAAALGWRAGAAAIDAAGCVRAGTCSLGCRYDAKQSGLLTYLPRAFAAGARLVADARVDQVEVLERDARSAAGAPPRKRVRAVARDPRTGAPCGTVTVDAPVVLLAAGAVGTPAILQRSGLGGGGVGRYLRLHPTTAVLGRYDREICPTAGIPQSALCDEFIRRDSNGYGFWIECPALTPGLAAAATSGFGPAHRSRMRDLPNVAAFIVLVRDGSGTIASQGAVWVDRRGDTRVRYRLGRADRANLAAGVEAAARLHLAAGAREAMTLHTPMISVLRESDLARIHHARYGPNRLSMFSAHVNGTCRIGTDPATSGCTPDGERHGVRGLHVCDGSLLPTSLGVNPQETIMALASVVAERILGTAR